MTLCKTGVRGVSMFRRNTLSIAKRLASIHHHVAPTSVLQSRFISTRRESVKKTNFITKTGLAVSGVALTSYTILQTLNNKTDNNSLQVNSPSKPFKKEIPCPLPRIMHRIWFGSFLRDQYQKYILNFKKNNPHFRIIIWTDFKGLNLQEINEFKRFCSENNIYLENIREHSHLLNYSLIEKELDDGLTHDAQNSRVHFVRASDLARISILFRMGGLYTDTDTDCWDSLPEIYLPLGLIIKSAKKMNPIENNELDSELVYYDFIGALPGNKILALCADISKLDYRVYSMSTHLEWRSSKMHHIHQASTITLTGTPLMVALKYIIKNNPQHINELKNIFFDSEPYMPTFYHKSWLDHLNEFIPDILEMSEEKRMSEQKSLESFLQEIESYRANYLSQLNVPCIHKNAAKIKFYLANDSGRDVKKCNEEDKKDKNDSAYRK